MDALRSLDSIPAVKQASLSFNRAKRTVQPYTSFIARMLMVSAFFEDAFRTIIEYRAQLVFFSRELYIPAFLALTLIAISTCATFLGVIMVFFKKTEKQGAQLLLFAVVYQQVIYGRHSPITSGNIGFLIRNLCLIGNLLLLMTSRRIRDGLPALPGIPDSGSKNSSRDSISVATRLLFGLLCLEMFDVIGWRWAILILPITLALLIGYKTDVMGISLMAFYMLATLSSKQFWSIDVTGHVHGTYARDVMRFEFLQTFSIMGGLLMLIMTGPGSLSLDEKLKRNKAW